MSARLCLAQCLLTNAVTQLTNYDFNSMARFGGAHLAANENGLYLLGGVDDAGTPIDAYAEVYVDYGQAVRLVSLWVGMEASGNLEVTNTVDDRIVTSYSVEVTPDQVGDLDTGHVQHAHKIFCQPHREKGQYHRFKIGNGDNGSDFSIDDVTAVVQPLGERRTGT